MACGSTPLFYSLEQIAFGGYVKMKSNTNVWIVLALAFLAVLPLAAQVTTGSIVGVVYDQSGAVVANCKITAVDLETGATREAQTNDSGYYTIPSLPPAAYKVTANVNGFAVTTTQLTVLLGSTANFDFHLTPSSVSQSVA